MKSKITSLFLIAVLFSLVAVSAASMDDLTLSLSEDTLSKSINETILTIKNTNETENITVNIPSYKSILGNSIELVQDTEGNSIIIKNNSEEQVNIYYESLPSLEIGEYTGSLNVENNSNSSQKLSKTLTFINSFCGPGAINDSNLELEVDIDNLGEGDDNEWYPLDELEIEVEFTNDKNIDLDDVFLEIGLIEEETGKNIADDLIWKSSDDEEVEIGNIDEDEEDYHIFNFKVDPEAGVDKSNYILVVKAYPDGEEDNVCIDYSTDLEQTYYEKIDVKREDAGDDRAIFIDTEDILLTEASCEEQINIDADVYNIGDEDQEAVMVNLYNSDLGINLNKVFRRGLDEGDKEQASFSFSVPKPQEEKTHYLELRAFYDYDDDYDIENSAAYDETSKAYTTALKLNNCKEEKKSAQIGAELDPSTPTPTSGKQVAIRATLENTGDVETSYTISVSGTTGWSSVNRIDPQTMILEPEETKTTTIFLDINDDAKGEKEFTIRANFNGDSIEQQVALNVEEGAQLNQITEHLRDNWFIYVIILINIILIIAIISVAKRLVRQPQAR